MATETTFRIDIKFANEGEIYGSETHWAAGSEQDLDQVVDRLVGSSRFDDERIPDRSVSFEFEPCDANEVPEGATIHHPEASFSL